MGINQLKQGRKGAVLLGAVQAPSLRLPQSAAAGKARGHRQGA